MSAVLSPLKPCVKLQQMSTDSCTKEPFQSENSFADYLPWHDVIFKHILPSLDLRSILSLHSANHTFKRLVEDYQYYVKSFDINEAGNITPEVFTQITGGMCSLQALALGPNSWITDRLAVDLIMQNPNLNWISLSDCPQLTHATVLKIALHCPRLQGLNLTGCGWVSTDTIRTLVRRCPRLQALDLTRCARVNDQGMACIAGGAKMLQSLNICGCPGVTDVGVAHITLLPNLRHVNVRATNITDYSVILMARHLPSLTHVDVASCRKVSPRALLRLKAANPRVQTDVRVRPYRLAANHRTA